MSIQQCLSEFGPPKAQGLHGVQAGTDHVSGHGPAPGAGLQVWPTKAPIDDGPAMGTVRSRRRGDFDESELAFHGACEHTLAGVITELLATPRKHP